LISLLWIGNCVYFALHPEGRWSESGINAGMAIAIYAAAECLVLFRGNRRVERRLGIANLGCAAFIAFAIVSNIAEAVFSGSNSGEFSFWFWFLLFGALAFGYLLICGIHRLRRNVVTADCLKEAAQVRETKL
jgi:Kef-type K+ transport system membrane component KefB